MPKDGRAQAPPRQWLLYACFVGSGAAGLILEIVWSKYLSLLLGNSIYGVSMVVAAFLGGLGLGAWLGGRVASRVADSLLLYARLEIAVGVAGLVSPLAYLAAKPIFAALYGAAGGAGPVFLTVRFLVLFVALLPPTVAMGASLPLLASDFARRGAAFAPSVGRLYAFNTAGAVVGVVAAGFLLIPMLGLWRTTTVAAVLDFLVAFAIITLRAPAGSEASVKQGAKARGSHRDAEAGRAAASTVSETSQKEPHATGSDRPGISGKDSRDRERARPETSRKDSRDTGRERPEPLSASSSGLMARLIVPFFALSGFTAILYEIAWTRILSVPLGGMVYALSAILALYLLGLAGGSAIGARLLRAYDAPVFWFGIFQTLLAATVAFGGHVFGLIPDWQASLIIASVGNPESGLVRLMTGEAAIAALVVLPPTLVLGALFPTAAAIRQRGRPEAGAAVGTVYAANTFGSIAGALLTGFILIPAVGALKAILAAAALNVAMGLAALAMAEVPRRQRIFATATVAASALVFTVGALPVWPAQRMSIGFTRLLRAYRFGGSYRGEKIAHDLVATSGTTEGTEHLRFYREGRLASVAVIESPGRVALVVNGKPDATIGTGEDMMTQVMIGQLPLMMSPQAQDVCIVGYGSGVTTHAVLTHPVREALTLEIEAAVIEAAPYFKEGAFEPLSDPRSRLVIEDAGTYLRSTSRKFDVIISEPSNPWIAGIGDLFTREFYDMAASRLRPGGLFCQWLQCYEISPPTMWTIFRTLAARFPGGQIFFFRPSNDLVIVTSPDKDLTLDPAVLEKAFGRKEVAEDLARVGVVSVADMLRYYRGRLDRIARLAGDGPINTDDNGWLEHRAPLDLIKPAQRGEPLGWSDEVAEDLARSLGPDADRSARLLVDAVNRAIEVHDRGSARGCIVALERLGRPEAVDLRPRLAQMDETIDHLRRAQNLLSEASPLVAQASGSGDAALGERAAAMLNTAAQLDPANGDIAARHGTALITANRPEEAIRELRRALGLLPPSRHLALRRDLAIASFVRRDYSESMLELGEMDRLRPGSAEARYWRARVLIEQGDRVRARAEVKAGLADDPGNSRLADLNRKLEAN